MGNCQTAEAATVLIQHPAAGRVERIYWSVSAGVVMGKNPGHYVALVVNAADAGAPIKQLKLLRPSDTLLVGHVYRLVTFEDVLKEFAAKKCVKLGKLLKERGGLVNTTLDAAMKKSLDRPIKTDDSFKSDDHISDKMNEVGQGKNSNGGRRHTGTSVGQWKPALQSIAEVGTTS